MTYTTHGVHIEGTPLEGKPDFRVGRGGQAPPTCGGPGGCDVCSVDAANATGNFELHPDWDLVDEAYKSEVEMKVLHALLKTGLVVDQIITQLIEQQNARTASD